MTPCKFVKLVIGDICFFHELYFSFDYTSLIQVHFYHISVIMIGNFFCYFFISLFLLRNKFYDYSSLLTIHFLVSF